MFGHIIPKTGIFLRTIEGGEEYETYRPPVSPTLAPLGAKTPPTPTAITIMITFEKRNVDGKEICKGHSGEARHLTLEILIVFPSQGW